ncbi:MAG: hypothetical protein LRY73_17980 [Bacillus sp. (in: Bacteria)]|nr:hypothetical protein [Bacillus sp. (in: firmicutes)]
MEPIILMHIILGSILTLAIIVTLFFLIKFFMTPKDNRATAKKRLITSAIITVAIYVGYMGMVAIKNNFF